MKMGMGPSVIYKKSSVVFACPSLTIFVKGRICVDISRESQDNLHLHCSNSGSDGFYITFIFPGYFYKVIILYIIGLVLCIYSLIDDL